MTNTITETIRARLASLKAEMAAYEKALAILEGGTPKFGSFFVGGERAAKIIRDGSASTRAKHDKLAKKDLTGKGTRATSSNGHSSSAKSDARPIREIIMNILQGGSLPRKEIVAEVLKLRKTTEGTIGGTLNAMHKAGAVKNADGKWWLTG